MINLEEQCMLLLRNAIDEHGTVDAEMGYVFEQLRDSLKGVDNDTDAILCAVHSAYDPFGDDAPVNKLLLDIAMVAAGSIVLQ